MALEMSDGQLSQCGSAVEQRLSSFVAKNSRLSGYALAYEGSGLPVEVEARLAREESLVK
jgi:hypothetical protein